MRVFRFSVTYLMWLFAALLVDHYLPRCAAADRERGCALRQIEYRTSACAPPCSCSCAGPRCARHPRPAGGTVHGNGAARHLQPGTPAGRNREVSALGAVEQAGVQAHILVDDDRAVLAVVGRDESQPAALVGDREVLLLVAGASGGLGVDQICSRCTGCVSEGLNSLWSPQAGAHALHVAHANDGAVAHGVLVLELALEEVGDDLHVAMPVLAEALSGGDAVVVDDAQRA